MSFDATFWTIVGVAIAALTAVISIVLFILQRQIKLVSYEAISGARLLIGPMDSFHDELELRYRGQIVEDPFLLLLRVINNGNQPITPTDFVQPLYVQFDSGCELLLAEIAKTSPSDLQVDVKHEGSKAILEPLLLNSGDWLALKLLLRKVPTETTVGGRITGVKQIKKYERNTRAAALAALPLAIPSFIIFVIGIIRPGINVYFVAGGILLVVSTALYVWLVYRQEQKGLEMKVTM